MVVVNSPGGVDSSGALAILQIPVFTVEEDSCFSFRYATMFASLSLIIRHYDNMLGAVSNPWLFLYKSKCCVMITYMFAWPHAELQTSKQLMVCVDWFNVALCTAMFLYYQNMTIINSGKIAEIPGSVGSQEVTDDTRQRAGAGWVPMLFCLTNQQWGLGGVVSHFREPIAHCTM